MSARAIVLLDRDDHDVVRWAVAAAIVLAAHLGLVATYLLFFANNPPGVPVPPAVFIDMAPVPVSPASPVDAEIGPEMVEAQPPSEPQVEPLPPEPIIEPTPPMEKAVVALPEPPKEPPPPEVKEEEPKPKEKPPEKRVERKKPAPRTTAAPRSETNTADRPAATSAGAAAARVEWGQLVTAQLQRAKRQVPIRVSGTVVVSITLSRSGSVLGRRITRSSGVPEHDQEALAMVARAQPFPPAPAGVTKQSETFDAPIQFLTR